MTLFLGFCDRIPADFEMVGRARWRVGLTHPLGGHPVKERADLIVSVTVREVKKTKSRHFCLSRWSSSLDIFFHFSESIQYKQVPDYGL